MTSRNFIYKFFRYNLILILIFLFVTYLIHDKYPKNALKNKEYLIKRYDPKIIFAGDSRAAKQMNVNFTQNLLKLKNGDVVNIAITSGDVIMVNNLADKYPEKFKDSILVISLSANQMNDNQKDIGYFRDSMISKLDFMTQLKTFVPGEIKTLIKYYSNNYKSLFFSDSENHHESTFGFDPTNGIVDIKNLKIERVLQNPWYKNYSDGGIKFKLTKGALGELKTKVKKLYVYTAPFSPTYISLVSNHRLLDNEMSFKNRVAQICKSENIEFKNYLTIEELKDIHFYDLSHLNSEGTIIFTKKVINDFKISKREIND